MEEFLNKQKQDRKKKRRKKEAITLLVVIIILAVLYGVTVMIKRHNVSKLGNDYCQYNGEHPIETGASDEIRETCEGCSKIMKFTYRTPNELCSTCAQELHRCEQCGKLLND